MVGEEGLESVSQEVDEGQPQSSGKQDGTQHRSGLRWQIVSAQKRHNTAFVNNRVKYDARELQSYCIFSDRWLTAQVT